MTQWKVTKEEAGMRLTQFIQNHLSDKPSLKHIKAALDNRACKLNGNVERFASYLVRENDVIDYAVPQAKQRIEILFQDEHLAVVNKPPFIICDAEKGLLGFKLAHRLDKETTGCLLLAKTEKAEIALIAMFKEKTIKKMYMAVADGVFSSKPVVVETPVGAKEAKTSFMLEKRGKVCSLVKCRPETGRTHQIRIHLASLGHPVLGDLTYSKKFESSYAPSRILLHAEELTFIHPFTQKKITVSAPPPQEFYEALNH